MQTFPELSRMELKKVNKKKKFMSREKIMNKKSMQVKYKLKMFLLDEVVA